MFYAACVAAIGGVIVAVGVVTAQHHSDVPPVVDVELVWPE